MALWPGPRRIWLQLAGVTLALVLGGFFFIWPQSVVMPAEEVALVVHPASIVQVELEAECRLCDAPAWDAATGRLLFVDITNKEIHSYDPRLKTHEVVRLAQTVGAAVPTNRPGTVVAALEQEIVAVEVGAGAVEAPVVIAAVPDEEDEEGDRFNKAKVSPAGVLIAGRMNTCPECREGAIYSLKSAAKLHRVTHEKMLLPNGMAWNISHQIMYFADTFADAVYVYKTDSRGIPLPKKRSLAFRVHQPGGLTLDSAGNVWVVSAELGYIYCFTPAGVEVQRVLLPVTRATGLTFGGPQLDIMYVTARASVEGQSSQLGSVYSLKIGGIAGAAAAYAFSL